MKIMSPDQRKALHATIQRLKDLSDDEFETLLRHHSEGEIAVAICETAKFIQAQKAIS